MRVFVKLFLRLNGNRRRRSLLEASMQSYEVNQVNICGAVVCATKLDVEAVKVACEKLSKFTFCRTVFEGNIVRVTNSAFSPSVSCEEGEEKDLLEVVMQRELNVPFESSNECPFRVVVLRGQKQDCLIMVGKHVHFDGLSALELLKRLLIFVKDPNAVFDDSPVANCDEFVLLGGYMPLMLQLVLCVCEIFSELRFFRLSSRSGKPSGSESAVKLSKKSCAVAEAKSKDHCNFVTRTLSEEETERIVQSARTHACTVGTAIAAAAMKEQSYGEPGGGDVWISMQADFRRITPSLSKGAFLFGNLTPVISLSRQRSALKSNVWDLAKGMR